MSNPKISLVTGKHLARLANIVMCAIILTGCTAQQSIEQSDARDPFERLNRKIYRFNEIADKYVARPVAKGYQFVTPSVFRRGVTNFFDNIAYPFDILNDVLQGKFKQTGLDTSRFIINSTIGIIGLMDPATDVGLIKHDEDFGQTMGVWGIPQGPYIMVPFFGPRTIRSGIGDVAELYVNPQFWLFSNEIQTEVNIFWLIHRRSTLLGIDEEIQRAYDPYAFVRDAYLQNREYLRYDGNPPEPEFDFEDEDFEDETR